MIEHTPSIGGQPLFVGIPITESSESSTASNLLNEIINAVSNNAPSQGDSTNLNITHFTLNDIVPEKPFFSYTGKDEANWIVFGFQDAIPLSTSILNTLGEIIKPFSLPTQGKGLFYNSSGPNSTSKIGDGIYISCKPTGSSKEETAVTYDKETTTYDLGSILKNPNVVILFQIIIGCLIFVLFFSFLNYIYKYFTSDAPKLSLKFPGIN